MYKPHTIEQYKIQQFLDANFAMEHFLVSPLSRISLLLEDKTGDQIAFGFLDNKVQEIEEKQMEILNRINSVQSAVDGIEKDIYEDDENYEFEIVCPYC